MPTWLQPLVVAVHLTSGVFEPQLRVAPRDDTQGQSPEEPGLLHEMPAKVTTAPETKKTAPANLMESNALAEGKAKSKIVKKMSQADLAHLVLSHAMTDGKAKSKIVGDEMWTKNQNGYNTVQADFVHLKSVMGGRDREAEDYARAGIDPYEPILENLVQYSKQIDSKTAIQYAVAEEDAKNSLAYIDEQVAATGKASEGMDKKSYDEIEVAVKRFEEEFPKVVQANENLIEPTKAAYILKAKQLKSKVAAVNRAIEDQLVKFNLDVGKSTLKTGTARGKKDIKYMIQQEKDIATIENDSEDIEFLGEGDEALAENSEEWIENLYEMNDSNNKKYGLNVKEETAEEELETGEEVSEELIEGVEEEDQYTLEDTDAESTEYQEESAETIADMEEQLEEKVLNFDETEKEVLDHRQTRNDVLHTKVALDLKKGAEIDDQAVEILTQEQKVVQEQDNNAAAGTQDYKSGAAFVLDETKNILIGEDETMTYEKQKQIEDEQRKTLADQDAKFKAAYDESMAAASAAGDTWKELMDQNNVQLGAMDVEVDKLDDSIAQSSQVVKGINRQTTFMKGLKKPLIITMSKIKDQGVKASNMLGDTQNVANMALQAVVAASQKGQSDTTRAVTEYIGSQTREINDRILAINTQARLKAEEMKNAVNTKMYAQKTHMSQVQNQLNQDYQFLQDTLKSTMRIKGAAGAMSSQMVDDVKNLNRKVELIHPAQEPVLEQAMKDAAVIAVTHIDKAVVNVNHGIASSAARMTSELANVKTGVQKASALQDAFRQQLEDSKQTMAKRAMALDQEILAAQQKNNIAWGTIGKTKTAVASQLKTTVQASGARVEQVVAEGSHTADAEVSAFEAGIKQSLDAYKGVVAGHSQTILDAAAADRQHFSEISSQDASDFRNKELDLKGGLQEAASEITKLAHGIQSEDGNLPGMDAIHKAQQAMTQVATAADGARQDVERIQAGMQGVANSANQGFSTSQEAAKARLAEVGNRFNANVNTLVEDETAGEEQMKLQLAQGRAAVKNSADKDQEHLSASSARIFADKRAIDEKAYEASQEVEDEAAKAKHEVLKAQLALGEEVANEMRMADSEGGTGANVASDMERGQALLDHDFMAAEAKAAAQMQKLDSGGAVRGINDVVAGLRAAQSAQAAAVTNYANDAAAGSYEISQRTDSVIAEAVKSLSGLQPKVTALKDEEAQALEEYKAKVSEDAVSTHMTGADILGAADFLKRQLAERSQQLGDKLRNAEGTLSDMNKLAGYASGDSLKRVHDGVVNGVQESGQLDEEVFNGIDKHTRELRERIGQVFSGMGFELDMNEVDKNAAAGAHEELSNKEKLLAAQTTLTEELRKAEEKKDRELKLIANHKAAEMDKIRRMVGLSAQEKANRIAALEADAAASREKVLAAARAQIATQQRISMGMERKEIDMDTLLMKASVLSGGGFQTTDRQFLQDGFGELKGKIKQVKDKYANPVTGLIHDEAMSLLQEQDTEHVGAAASSGESAARAFRTIESQLDHHWEQADQQDKHWEQVLATLTVV